MAKVMTVKNNRDTRKTRAHSDQDASRLAHTKTRSPTSETGVNGHGVGARAPHTHAAPSQPQGDSEHSHAFARTPLATCQLLMVLRRRPRASNVG